MAGRRVFGGVVGACIISAWMAGAAGFAPPPTGILSLSLTPDEPTVEVGQQQGINASALLADGQTRVLGGGGSAFWQMAFAPAINVSVCGTAATSYNSQNWAIDSNGAFHEVWSVTTPNTLKADGLMTLPTATAGASVTAALACVSGAASGSLTAFWNNTRYEGTFTFNGASGNIVVAGLTWTSSDPSVATVNQRGMVTAVAPGDATITATYGSECWQSPSVDLSCAGTVSGTAVVHVVPADGGGGGGGGGGPILSAGDDRTVQCTGNSGASVTLDGSIAFEPTEPITYTWTGPFGTASGLTPTVLVPLGSNTLTFTISNGVQSASDTVDITVEDTVPPSIASVTASPSRIWPPDQRMVDVQVSVSASDACDASLNCRIVAIASNEPSSGSDWEATGPLTARLRASRSAQGGGRVYTITVRCTDDAGLSATKEVTVTVPHDRDGI